MNHIGGMGGFAPLNRYRKVSLSRKGKKALSQLNPDSDGVLQLSEVHDDSESLRRFAERFAKKKHPDRESVAKFEMDQESGKISVKIYDAQTGQLEVILSPEEVAEGLKGLEETQDNESSLSSFFVDLKV